MARIEITNNYIKHYLNEKLHREDDKPAFVMPMYSYCRESKIMEYCGDWLEWRIDGELHRENDKPAKIDMMSGDYEWREHGVLHRDNGLPAVLHGINGISEWWVNGEKIDFSYTYDQKLAILGNYY